MPLRALKEMEKELLGTASGEVASGGASTDAWRLLLTGGLLGRFLRYADVARLGSLSRRFRALNGEGWREAWRQCSGGQEPGEVVRVMGEAVRVGRAEHVRAMVAADAGRRPWTISWPTGSRMWPTAAAPRTMSVGPSSAASESAGGRRVRQQLSAHKGATASISALQRTGGKL